MSKQPRQQPQPTRRLSIRFWANTIIIALAFIVVIVIVLVGRAQSASQQAAAPAVTRADSRILQKATTDKVTVVEFLDFECEACGAAYPVVEQLREQYKGRVTFIARYFPIPSHKNAMNAAMAAEAAGRQGKFTEMYSKLFQTQTQWAERQDDQSPALRSLAASIGLDMTQYDKDIADPTLRIRVTKDQADGVQLGVAGTPTFFLNGEKLTLTSKEQFASELEKAWRR
ncbi:MAG: thioredoxin domain-containing protein [Actinobacteria bacterium]|uniref:Thioredoxin domain-containing protein n=1 Tax=Leifsonia shinshuensis TaxID=150026 RepID=A0A7G6YBR1_9MICO|nr:MULTISPECIES: thioredoxin domain-containing protein [Leifsonia]MBN9632156.1 thioredoxin domain-containing protein [Actinomycetota bacterium]NUU08633.1 thioredoxin domain-containing protein [Leifsonia sp. C5G2]QNE35926.1 thioredoxin domain-containing protein [Leifsonia shinshuensis]